MWECEKILQVWCNIIIIEKVEEKNGIISQKWLPNGAEFIWMCVCVWTGEAKSLATGRIVYEWTV